MSFDRLHPPCAETVLAHAARAVLLGLSLVAAVAHAQQATQPAAAATSALDNAGTRTYDLPPGTLGRTLANFALQSGIALSFEPALTEGRDSAGLSGTHAARDAAARLLAGTGLELAPLGDGSFTLRRQAAPAAAAGTVTVLPVVKARSVDDPVETPAAYAGGKVARGGRVGILGNGDFMSTPVSVVAFTSEFRDDTQALSVSDMLKYSVSAQTPQSGSYNTTDVIYVRGFSVGSYDGTFDGLAGLLGRMPPVETIERVELLLGANTFANGQPGAVGGSINVVPKRAGDEPLARVGVSARTKSILGTTVDVGRRFGPDNSMGLRMNLGFSEGDTELADGRRRTVARALAFDWRGVSTRFTVDYMGNDRRVPAEAWFVVAAGVDVPDARRASRDFRQPWTFYKDEWDTVVTRGEWDFAPGWTASAALGRMWNKVERRSQVSEIQDNDGNMIDAWGGTFGHSKQNRVGHAHELSVRGEFALGPVKNVLRAGLTEFGERGQYQANYAPFDPFASNIYDPVDYPNPGLAEPDMPGSSGPKSRNKGLFVGNEFLMLEDRLRLTLGVRRVAFDAADGSEVKKKTSPAAGVLFRLQPTLSVYANYLEGLDSGFSVDQPNGVHETLPPQPAKQVEVGLKGDLGEVGFTAAVFQTNRASYITNGDGFTVNNGRQRNRGLELSLFGKPTSTLSVYGSTTFIDPKLTRTQDGVNDGKLAQSAARFLANLHADWSVPAAEGLGVLGAVSHSGKLYNDDANTQPLPGWTRLDAGVRYRTKVFGKSSTLRLTVDNLLDRKYWVSERGTIYFAPERTVSVSFTTDL